MTQIDDLIQSSIQQGAAVGAAVVLLQAGEIVYQGGFGVTTDNYLGYGLGFEIGRYRGVATAGHGGMNLTYNCFFKLFPEERAGVIVLTNQSDEPLIWELVTSLYDQVLALPDHSGVAPVLPTLPTLSLDPGQLQEYVGAYIRIESGDVATLRLHEGQLFLDRQGQSRPLHAVAPDHFAPDQFATEISATYRLAVAFVRNAAGAITHLLLGGEPYHPLGESATLPADESLWQSFAGTYKDPSNGNLDELYRVRLHEGRLFMAEGALESPCRALGPRTFLCEIGVIDFVEAAGGELILVWGKAVRYYPINKQRFEAKKVVEYLVDVPALMPRVG